MAGRDALRTLMNERLLARTPLRVTARGLDRRPQWSLSVFRVSGIDAIPRRAAELGSPTLTVGAIPGARLLADPFLFDAKEVLHLFFEVQRFRERGRIHHAESNDGVRWTITGDVLAEPFHLSYPQIVESRGHCWMLPETQGAGHVRLYRAADFPSRWEFAGELWPRPLADATVFRHAGLWWLLGTDKVDPSVQRLRLLVSDQLGRGWQEHPSSPVVTGNPRLVRSAGRPFVDRGKLWRLAQDGSQRYGGAVLRIPLIELTPSTYLEGTPEPLLKPSGQGWMSLGMHHLDILKREDDYLVALDGEGPARWPWESTHRTSGRPRRGSRLR